MFFWSQRQSPKAKEPQNVKSIYVFMSYRCVEINKAQTISMSTQPKTKVSAQLNIQICVVRVNFRIGFCEYYEKITNLEEILRIRREFSKNITHT